MSIKLILFDLDNTLYPASSLMGYEIQNLMTLYTSQLLKISSEKALQLRKEKVPLFGTTMKWLQQEHGFKDIEDFFHQVHPANIHDLVPSNPDLKELLASLPLTRAVLTNSPIEHASRVLNYLEIENEFQEVFDIRRNNFLGKPHASVYQNCLDHFKLRAEDVLFIDDIPHYLTPFTQLGGNVLLIDEEKRFPYSELPSLKSIMQLKDYLGENSFLIPALKSV